ncbi:F-box domain-containing protein [Cinnamomum micranthum f. kanehirae]|uniref:F-box domain-containing protein n=1 Tax=Cinnamomum micranthum f. kanehirae TaxID=337451 RepID=A0A3S3NBE5_9MAGN|nr:F-box domain-containing protein [Cinnamomum micranthum f. kanehirae]
MLSHHPSKVSAAVKRAKKRGSYNCGRCGVPKKGHVCNAVGDPISVPSNPTPPRSNQQLRRSLSFDDALSSAEEDDDVETAVPSICLSEVMRRLPPPALLSAAQVCRGWRDCARRVWRSAEELRLRVPPLSQVWFVGSVLRRCTGLVRLSLRIESDLDATMLACVAFSCPNLEAIEICTSDAAVNRITGDDLGRFVAEKRCLSSLKIEGCTNLGSLNLCSSSLSILWLSDLFSISKMAFNCPNLKELSLDFSRQENDSTDLINMVDVLGRSSLKLRNIHIASIRLSHSVVLALTSANLRGLRMLSLVLGSEITDASVAAITSSYTNLELLDLSGSSISDSGIGMICNVFPHTLSRLLLALCPNVTSSGIQFAAAQLPHLRLFDCGMTICDPSVENPSVVENGLPADNSSQELKYQQKVSNTKLYPMYQKLIIKHGRLKKLSLWGCSGLDALYLNCPELNDLNLNSCTNLHPERVLLQCPCLESVQASGCRNKLIGAIQNQVYNESAVEDYLPSKRLADGSKRVQVPRFIIRQPSDGDKERALRPRCIVHVD